MAESPLQDALNKIEDDDIRGKCQKLYDALKPALDITVGGKWHHHHWDGAYAVHVREVMGIAKATYDQLKGLLDEKANPPFTASDMQAVAFLHDLEKVDQYERKEVWDKAWKNKTNKWRTMDGWEYRSSYPIEQVAWIQKLCYKFADWDLPELYLHALSRGAGGWSKYSGIDHPISIILHFADVMSARLLGNPKDKCDLIGKDLADHNLPKIGAMYAAQPPQRMKK